MSDFSKNLWSASNLQLWKSYCDKKIECENLQEQLTTITKQRDELLSTLYDIYNEAVDYQSRTGKPVTWCLKVGNLLSTIKEQKDAE